MLYATFSEYAERYPTRLEAGAVTSHFLYPAARRLDALLGDRFAVPFSGNNYTAKDLTLDLAQLLLLQRSKAAADAEALRKGVALRIEALRSGEAVMVTTSGDVLRARPGGGGIWSSTQYRIPVFTPEARPWRRNGWRDGWRDGRSGSGSWSDLPLGGEDD